MSSNNYSASLQTVPRKISRRRAALGRREREKSATVELLYEQDNNISFEHFELSSTGIYVHSDYLLCPGDRVTIGLKLSTCGEPLEITGEVVRAETGNDGLRPGMSILFRDMARKERGALEHFLIRRITAHAG